MTKIPSKVLYHDETKFIPSEVALIRNKEDIENSNFLISFFYYNTKECEISNLRKNNAKRILNDIKTIGTSTVNTLSGNNIQSIRVINSGEYSKLFKKLPDGVDELFEHKANGTNRVFYFVEASKIFHIIAIRENHFEVGKNRR